MLLREPGEYAIETEEDGERTVVKAHSGEAEVTGPDSSQHGYIVGANEQGIFTGSDDLSSVMTQAGRRSGFELWAYEREAARRELGGRELRAAGNGRLSGSRLVRHVEQRRPSTATSGSRARRTCSNDWAPYRYGRWIWVTPWGWTWVDDSPWGYAPSHYGRWTYLRQRWCWVPGPRHIHATYAPALVAWVGSPSFGVHFRDVGWMPLGPREIYIPGRRSSWRYFHNVNAWNSMDNLALSNAYNGRNQNFNYRNRTAPHAVTVVNHDAFVSGRRTHGQRVDVDADDLQRWRGQGRVPAIAPNADSRLGARPTGRAPAPHLDRQSIATRHQPVTKQRVLPSADEDVAPVAVPQKASRRADVATRSGITRQWSGSNVGDRPGRLSRAQPGNGQALAPESSDAADASDDGRNRRSRDIAMVPRNAAHPNRDAPSRADRPPRGSTAANPRAPAPVATPQASPSSPDPQAGRPHLERQQRQERQAQNQQARQELQAQQQQARQDRQMQQQQARQAARERGAPQQQPNVRVPRVAPPVQAPQRQVVQQPRSAAPAPQGQPNGRAMAQPQQRETRTGRASQPSQQSSRSTNGTATRRQRRRSRWDVAVAARPR